VTRLGAKVVACADSLCGGCSSGLWLRVAAAREDKHPGDAVPIYQEMIAPTLKQANNTAYEEAVKLVQKIRELMGRLDRVTEFEDYLAALRSNPNANATSSSCLIQLKACDSREIIESNRAVKWYVGAIGSDDRIAAASRSASMSAFYSRRCLFA